MQINQLKYVVQVAKLLSFSKAADQLCVTQPALSHQIQKLEEEVGVSLFERKTRSVKLTYAGEVFALSAGKILTDLETLRKSMQEIRLARTGNIRVGTTSAHIVPDLFAHVSAFQNQCPGIRVQIVETAGSLSLADMLANGGVDAAFLISSAEDMLDARIRYYPLIRGRVALVVSDKHRFAGKKRIRLRDLAEESFVFPGRALSMHALALKICRESGFEPKILCECDQVDTVLSFVASGKGIGFISSQSIAKRLTPGVSVIPIEPVVERISCLAVPQDKLRVPIVEMFRDFLLEEIAQGAKPQKTPRDHGSKEQHS